MNEPRIRDDLPILIGGSGEKKTFGLAARYASHLNIIGDPAELPKKLAALDERCREVGRDRAEIETSFLASVALGKTGTARSRPSPRRCSSGAWRPDRSTRSGCGP